MKPELRNSIITLLVVGSFLGGAYWYAHNKKQEQPQLPFYGNKLVLEPNEYNSGLDSLIHRVSDFSFTNQEGKIVTQQTLKNKIYVADYIFTTCPGICKDMSREMRKLYKKYASNPAVVLVSHTSKPEEDSVAVLMEYAKEQGVNNHNKWHFLTGDLDSLYKIAVKSYRIVDENADEDDSKFVHTERMALVDTHGHIRGYYDGTSSEDVDRLMLDIDKLLTEHIYPEQ